MLRWIFWPKLLYDTLPTLHIILQLQKIICPYGQKTLRLLEIYTWQLQILLTLPMPKHIGFIQVNSPPALPHTPTASNHAMASASWMWNHFISKHAFGMYGVGKSIVLWKMHSLTAKCVMMPQRFVHARHQRPLQHGTIHLIPGGSKNFQLSVQIVPDMTVFL